MRCEVASSCRRVHLVVVSEVDTAYTHVVEDLLKGCGETIKEFIHPIM